MKKFGLLLAFFSEMPNNSFYPVTIFRASIYGWKQNNSLFKLCVLKTGVSASITKCFLSFTILKLTALKSVLPRKKFFSITNSDYMMI